jgi:hypothetical protein
MKRVKFENIKIGDYLFDKDFSNNRDYESCCLVTKKTMTTIWGIWEKNWQEVIEKKKGKLIPRINGGVLTYIYKWESYNLYKLSKEEVIAIVI